MDKFYNRFLRLGINLTPLGIETEGDHTAYFCTPKGASIIGWAGADGIHYCRIRSFGNMIFAVSPMNNAPDHVHPIAEDFATLLRLLLSCGDASALEQAWQWSEEQFNDFLEQNTPTEEAKTVLSEVGRKLILSPIENPWQYLHNLQENFDYSKIKYTGDIDDPDMNPEAEFTPPEWKVYFNGSFWGHQGKDHAGKEIPIGKEFEWAGHHWLIPAVYSCGKGLVVDFCMRVEADEIRSFMEKWNLNEENDSLEHFTREQQTEMESDNPLCLHFDPQLMVNGHRMRVSHGCGVTYDPCLPDGVVHEEAKRAMEHYGLDAAYGWVIRRSAFPWEWKRRPEIQTLFLTMEQEPLQIPGPHFKIHAPGDSFRFIHPVSRTEYTLIVQKLEQRTLDKNAFRLGRWKYPEHFTVMSYTLSPETSADITVSDCEDGDKPLETAPSDDLFAPSAISDAACIGIIGGADGPTAFVFGGSSKQGKLCAACSSLHFEPVRYDIEWRITFREKRFENFSIMLIEK